MLQVRFYCARRVIVLTWFPYRCGEEGHWSNCASAFTGAALILTSFQLVQTKVAEARKGNRLVVGKRSVGGARVLGEEAEEASGVEEKNPISLRLITNVGWIISYAIIYVQCRLLRCYSSKHHVEFAMLAKIYKLEFASDKPG